MNPLKFLVVFMSLGLFSVLTFPVSQAGEDKSEIKGFSDEEIRGLLNGEGMGVAKAAELNHYPGPRHVLDLSDQLHLTKAQCAEGAKIFDEMHKKAAELGKLIFDKERELEKLFAENKADENKIKLIVQEIASLQGELRFTHLRAHVQMKPVLSPEQITNYDFLKGYGPQTRGIPPHHHESP